MPQAASRNLKTLSLMSDSSGDWRNDSVFLITYSPQDSKYLFSN